MKKNIGLLAITALLFVSCDDEKEVDLLIGKWTPESIIINGENFLYTGNTNCGNDYLQLNEFNSFEIGDFYESDSSLKTTPVPPCPLNKHYGSYSVINNEIKLLGSSFFHGGLIIEKSPTILKLKKVFDINGDGKDDELIEVYKKS